MHFVSSRLLILWFFKHIEEISNKKVYVNNCNMRQIKLFAHSTHPPIPLWAFPHQILPRHHARWADHSWNSQSRFHFWRKPFQVLPFYHSCTCLHTWAKSPCSFSQKFYRFRPHAKEFVQRRIRYRSRGTCRFRINLRIWLCHKGKRVYHSRALGCFSTLRGKTDHQAVCKGRGPTSRVFLWADYG